MYIAMRFYRRVRGHRGGKRNVKLYFGGNPDHHTDCPISNPVITQKVMNGYDNEINGGLLGGKKDIIV